MKIKRQSPLTGKINEMDLPVTEAQMQEFTGPKNDRRLIQEIFPDLTPDQREFLLTGYTQEDWDAMFPPHERSETPGGHDWMEYAKNHYSAEMSVVSAGNTRHVKCPKCSVPVNKLQPTRVVDDITKWEGDHDCGAHLLIWND